MIVDVRNKINCVWNVSSFIAESKCIGRKIENIKMVNIVNESMDISVHVESPMLRRLTNRVGWWTIRTIPTSIRTRCSAKI
jgi:hypothetical protein